MNEGLESAIKELVKKLTAPPADKGGVLKKVLETLNAPFTVTLIGGVLLAMISAFFTQSYAEHSRKVELSLADFHQKQSFVDSFATKVEAYLALSYSVYKRKIFLDAWQNQSDRAQHLYPDGRTFEQTRDKWEQDTRYWIEHSPGSATALIYTAKLLFTKPAITAELNRMAKSVDTYGQTTNFEDLEKSYHEILDDLEKITSLFTNELNEK